MKKILSILLTLIMLLISMIPINGFAESVDGGLTVGDNHTFAIMADGSIKSWGYNVFGQIGLSDGANRSVPTSILGLNDFKHIFAGSYRTYLIMNDNTVKAWGNNDYGQLGLGDTAKRMSPTNILGLSGVKQIITGMNHTLALMNDGTVKAWGWNNYGQLGLGDNTNRTVPTTIPGLVDVKDIVAGGYQTFAIMIDGTVKTWGANIHGQLGLGDTFNRATPTVIPGLVGVKQLVSANSHNFAIMTDGTVKAWGYNSQGQLGLGNTVNKTTPTTITGLEGVSQFEVGSYHTLALMEDGSVKSWGNNAFGQLGLGNTTNRATPSSIPGLSGVKQLGAGENHSLALMLDGTVKSWGWNNQSQLGLGGTTNRTSPTLINITGVAMPVDEEDKAILMATNSTIVAETSKTQVDVDNARVLVTALIVGADKSDLTARLDVVQAEINAKALVLSNAVSAVLTAEAGKTQSNINSARALVDALPEGISKSDLMGRLDVVQSIIDAKLETINNATNKVSLAEIEKTQASVNEAITLVNSLPEGPEKVALLIRLTAINVGPIITSQEFKVADTKINLAMSLPREPYLSLALLAIEKVADPVEKAALVAEMQIAIEKSTASKPITTKTANLFVRLAEITGRDKYITMADTKTEQIIDVAEKQDAITRMDIAKLVKSPAERRAYSALIAAEQWKSTKMVTAVTKLINALVDGTLKTIMLDRATQIN